MIRLLGSAKVNKIGNEGIIVDLNRGRYISVNHTAILMIDAMEASTDEDEVLTKLTNLMDVELSTIEADFQEFCKKLIDLGLASDENPR